MGIWYNFGHDSANILTDYITLLIAKHLVNLVICIDNIS